MHNTQTTCTIPKTSRKWRILHRLLASEQLYVEFFIWICLTWLESYSFFDSQKKKEEEERKLIFFFKSENQGNDFSSALTSKEAMADVLPSRNYWSQGVDPIDSLDLVKIQGHLMWSSERSLGPSWQWPQSFSEFQKRQNQWEPTSCKDSAVLC